jgi:hypothetical protein
MNGKPPDADVCACGHGYFFHALKLASSECLIEGCRCRKYDRASDADHHERVTTGVDRRHWIDRNTDGFSNGSDT